jgi:hypothetical protein|tara:strand:+ start:6584 stop:6925 length:342 start_codon:yes stop_codon:yes gene_type:complete
MVDIIKKFSKHLTAVEYPKQKTSWNIAGIITGQNAFYKFDVGGLTKVSKDKAYKTGNINTKAEKMVFEFKDKWVILDVEELNKYIEKNKKKDLQLKDLISKLEWNIILLKDKI